MGLDQRSFILSALVMLKGLQHILSKVIVMSVSLFLLLKVG